MQMKTGTDQSLKASLSVILSGVLWGCIGFFIKTLSAAGLDSLQICAVRMTVSAFIFTAAAVVTGIKKLKIAPKDILMFVGTGIFSVVMFNCCYFYTIIHSQASVAVVLLYTSPVFVTVLSALFYKERITLKQVIALVLTFAGCVFVTGMIGGKLTLTPFVLMTGIGSGLFYALYTIFGRAALGKYDAMTVTTYTFIVGMIGSLPIGKLGETFEVLKTNPEIIPFCIGIGVFCTVLPYYFYTWGLQRTESGKAAVLVAVEPLVGAVIGIVFYHEPCDIFKISGIVLIIAAIILLNIRREIKNGKEALSDM